MRNEIHIFIIITSFVILFSGCLNDEDKDELTYHGADCIIDYGEINISSERISIAFEKKNITSIPEGNIIGLMFSDYDNYYNYPISGEGLSTRYRGHENDTIPGNLIFHITFNNNTGSLKESDQLLEQTYQNDLNILEEIATIIISTLRDELSLDPEEVNYHKLMDSEGDD